MAQYIYTMNRVGKVVPPKRVILRDISLSFFPGAKIGVLGLNGSGKSTLLKIMGGIDTNFEGEARAQSGIKVGYLPQEPELDPNKDVRSVVMEGLGGAFAQVARFNEISDKFAEPMDDEEMNKLLEEQAKLQDAIDVGRRLGTRAQARDRRGRAAPAALGRRSSTSCRAVRNAAWRCAACCCPRPTCCCWTSPPTTSMPNRSRGSRSTSRPIHPPSSRSRTIATSSTTWPSGFSNSIAATASPTRATTPPGSSRKERGSPRKSEPTKACASSSRPNSNGCAPNPKGRRAKNKARVARYEELASREFQERNETNEIYIPPGERLGDLVIEAKNLRKSYGDRLLIDNLNFNLPAGGIVGIIGPNGAGKTTLFRMIAGMEKPDAGEIRMGPSVKLAYVDQSRQSLNDKNTVWQEISGGLDMIKVGNYETPSRGYVGRFNFKGTGQQQNIGELSGGERNRVHLAKVLKSGGNVLMLDEPTNDLDVETLRALEEALLAYPGCAVVISHDRWFLDRIATHILAFEGNSEVVWFEGNFQDYMEDLKRRKGEEATQPHRIKYKPLTR